MMNNDIGFNINNMETISKNFITKLGGLEELRLSADCKLGVYNEVTYVSWRRLQNLNRWWYGENRAKLIDFLTETFEEYYLFSEMMREALETEHQPYRKARLLKLNDNNKSKMKGWLLGISCVQAQYPDYDKAKILTNYVQMNFSQSSSTF
jgi:hypothetical protein